MTTDAVARYRAKYASLTAEERLAKTLELHHSRSVFDRLNARQAMADIDCQLKALRDLAGN